MKVNRNEIKLNQKENGNKIKKKQKKENQIKMTSVLLQACNENDGPLKYNV